MLSPGQGVLAGDREADLTPGSLTENGPSGIRWGRAELFVRFYSELAGQGRARERRGCLISGYLA